MKKEYEEAFAEVDEIFQLMPVDLLIKIPLQFKKLISENKSQNYITKIKEPIKEEDLKYETRVILGLIYRDFLADPEEREKLQAQDAEELRKIEEELQKQYDVDNIFRKRKDQKNTENEEDSTDMIVYKEQGFLQKIFNLIKGIFSKNKF